jgi:glycosyltransferase involved in cell wall biosynthesis
MQDKKILGLYYDEIHPVHEAWFQEVGDLKGFSIDPDQNPISKMLKYIWNAKKIPDKYDVLLSESKIPLRTAFIYKIFNRDTEIILLVGEQNLYECVEKGRNDFEEKLTHSFVDGAIANSEFMEKYAERYLDGEVPVVEPFIPGLEELLEVEREYKETKEICFVGYNYPNKNVSSLVEAVKDTEYKLHIVGKGHPEYDQENVEVHGYVEDLTKIYDRCDLYVQPSDGDAFGIAPLEAMAYGIPAIVTETTGAKKFLEKLPDFFISNSNSESLKTSIEKFYSVKFNERENLARKSRETVSRFTEESSLKNFTKKLGGIIGDN